MSDFTDVDTLKSQYKDSGNYGARVRFHARYKTNPQDMHTWAFDHLLASIPAGGRVLELGGGRADLWIRNAERIPPGWEIIFSDFSAGMLADAQALLGGQAGRFAAFEVIDAQAIPYPDASFDAVIAHMMLYHVPDRAAAIAEIRRVLKPNGALYAMTLGEDHLSALYDWVRQAVPELGFSLNHTDNPFSIQNAEAQLRAAFDVIEISHYANSIAVTEVEPLVEYIASLQEHAALLADTPIAAAFRAAAAAKITAEGAIRAQTNVALFRSSTA